MSTKPTDCAMSISSTVQPSMWIADACPSDGAGPSRRRRNRMGDTVGTRHRQTLTRWMHRGGRSDVGD